MKKTVVCISLISFALSGCAAIRKYRLEEQRKLDDRIYYSIFLPQGADMCARDIAFKGHSDFDMCNQYKYRSEMQERISRLKKQVEGLSPEQIKEATNGTVKMGMSYSEVRLALGKPDKINNTTGSYGTHSQWVYEGVAYIYFEGGKVTAWQNY